MEELQKKLEEENRPELEFLEEWNKSLQERLNSPDLRGWLRTAISLTLEENNRQIEKLNDQISRKIDQTSGLTGL